MTTIAPLGDRDPAPVVALIAQRQADPTTHVVYLGEDALSIGDELAEYDAWRERTLVATDELGAVTGVVLADIDEEMRRAWWVGPWTRDPDEQVSNALLDEAVARFGGRVDQQELAPDERNTALAAIAASRGFHLDTPSAVLSLELYAAPDGPDGGAAARTLPLREADHEAVAALHDELFPGTHTPGAALVVAERSDVRVVHVGDRVAGYVATEVQPDGTGYIDFLGVLEELRRRGLGRSLVQDAVGDLAMRGVPSVHLTVRADRPGPRALYASLGFTHERVIAPYRLGFTLG